MKIKTVSGIMLTLLSTSLLFSLLSVAPLALSTLEYTVENTGYKGEDAIAVGDVDGDGIAEIAFRSRISFDELGLFLLDDTDNDGLFGDEQALMIYSIVPAYLGSVVMGDIDGDNRDEIVFKPDYRNNNLWVYDVQTESILDLGIRASGTWAIGDIDGDGTDEIIYGDADFWPPLLTIYDKGVVYHMTLEVLSFAEFIPRIAVTDVDGDEIGEIVYRSWESRLMVLNDSDSDGDFTDETPFDTGIEWDIEHLASCDVDGDLEEEVAFSLGSILVIFDYETNALVNTGEKSMHVAGGDLDDDGMDEVAFNRHLDPMTSNLTIYDYQTNETIITNYSVNTLVIGDVDKDIMDEVIFSRRGLDLMIFHWLPSPSPPVDGIHNIAVTNIKPHKTIVAQGYSLHINTTIQNKGNYTETFNITICANTTAIASQTITLTSANSTTIAITWNTSGFAKGNYTITATATSLPSETDTTDNTRTCWIVVTIAGDVDGDLDCDADDVFTYVSPAYGKKLGQPGYNPNCDFDGDNDCDADDVFTCLAPNYGKKDC